MKIIELLVLFSLISSVFCKEKNNTEKDQGNNDQGARANSGPSKEQCARKLYSRCNYQTTFTEEELENVRQFFNYSFTVLADIKPDKPLCPKLHVRRDWKCLTPKQKKRFTDVWAKLYERGIIQNLTEYHNKYWTAWHKSTEFLPSHRWYTNEFERYMRQIDHDITLPYWDPYAYGAQPERSSLWDIVGNAGNYSNGYEVPDGVTSRLGLIPTLKRHWSSRGTLYPWYTQEVITSIIQSSNSYGELLLGIVGIHFPPHFVIGGYEGQYSSRDAAYDPIFYLGHTHGTDLVILRWSLRRKDFLTPLSYNYAMPSYDKLTGLPVVSSIERDTLTGVPSVTIREMFWIGFGDQCFIHDQLVRPINNLMKGIRDPIPTAAKRLPEKILRKYFPDFYSGHFSGLLHTFEELGDCNRASMHGCAPIPKPTFFQETEAGRRFFEMYRSDNGIDRGSDINVVEKRLLQMWSEINQSGYCSPYATTY